MGMAHYYYAWSQFMMHICTALTHLLYLVLLQKRQKLCSETSSTENNLEKLEQRYAKNMETKYNLPPAL